MDRLLLVESPLEFFGCQPVRRVGVRQSRFYTALIFWIGGMAQVEEKRGDFALLGG